VIDLVQKDDANYDGMSRREKKKKGRGKKEGPPGSGIIIASRGAGRRGRLKKKGGSHFEMKERMAR